MLTIWFTPTKVRFFLRTKKLNIQSFRHPTFLARGKRKKNGRRGADVRMSLVEDLEVTLERLMTWKLKQGSYVDLFKTFRALNNDYAKKPIS